jgi:hypothetical protein
MQAVIDARQHDLSAAAERHRQLAEVRVTHPTRRRSGGTRFVWFGRRRQLRTTPC